MSSYRTPTEGIDYSSKDYDGFKDLMIKVLQRKMPEYTDTSETDAGIVIIEALANGLDILSLYQDIIANDVFLSTTQDRSLATIIAKTLGYTPYNQTASRYKQVFVLSQEAPSGGATIPKGTVVSTEETDDDSAVYFETVDDLVIPEGCLGNETNEVGKYLYTVEVEQGESIGGEDGVDDDEKLGSSSGASFQTFRLNYPNVLVDTIQVHVKEDNLSDTSGWYIWERVDNFIDSGPESRVFTATMDEFGFCTIQFGDNSKGHIPPAGIDDNIVASYRVGGGSVNNVNNGEINVLVTDTDYVVEETFNVETVRLGYDRESLESIKENASATFRTRDSLVTLLDYENALKLNFFNVLDVKAIRGDKDTENPEADTLTANVYIMLREEDDNEDSAFNAIKPYLMEYIKSKEMIGVSANIYKFTPEVLKPVIDLYISVPQDELAEYTTNLKEEVEALFNATYAYGSFTFDDPIVKADIEKTIKNELYGVEAVKLNLKNSSNTLLADTAILYPTKPQNIFVFNTEGMSSNISVHNL